MGSQLIAAGSVLTSTDEQRIVALYHPPYRWGLPRIARQYGVKQSVIWRVLRHNKVRLRTRLEAGALRRKTTIADRQLIVSRYIEGKMSAEQIAPLTNVSGATVTSILHSYDGRSLVRTRSEAQRLRVSKIERYADIIERAHKAGATLDELARGYGCSRGTVKAVLLKRGVRLRTTREAAALREARRTGTLPYLSVHQRTPIPPPSAQSPQKRLASAVQPLVQPPSNQRPAAYPPAVRPAVSSQTCAGCHHPAEPGARLCAACSLAW